MGPIAKKGHGRARAPYIQTVTIGSKPSPFRTWLNDVKNPDSYGTLWLLNIAMEHGPFIDDS
jgi:hypothetical protein